MSSAPVRHRVHTAAELAIAEGRVEDVFETLHEECDQCLRDYLFDFLRRRVRKDVALTVLDDLAHDVWLDLLEHPEDYDPALASIRTYLTATLGLKHAMRFIRARQRQQQPADDPSERSCEPWNPAPNEMVGRVMECLKHLPEAQQQVARAYATYGPDEYPKRLAKLTGEQPNTIATRWKRTKAKIRRVMESKGYTI